MAEYRLFPAGQVPHVSTAAFHANRPRAPHLEQDAHRGRLATAAEFVWYAAEVLAADGRAEVTVSDLGCGDGGLLSIIAPHHPGPSQVKLRAWGYDIQPSNILGGAERGVDAELLDVAADRERVRLGHIAITTEFLEHLADPHGMVRWLGVWCPFLVASSPWGETPASHDPCHAWAWDWDGYAALLRTGGYFLAAHRAVGPFQVALGAQEPAFDQVLARAAGNRAAR